MASRTCTITPAQTTLMKPCHSLALAAMVFPLAIAAALFAGTGPATAHSVSFIAARDYAVGNIPHAVTMGDFNGDGKPDLAVANNYSNDVSVLPGNGDGTFQPQMNFAAGQGPVSVTVDDFNGDGKSDLAVVNRNSNNVSVLLGNGDGRFQLALNFVAGSAPHSAATGDFNGDGKPDLAIANSGSNDVSVLLGLGNGLFQLAVNFAVGTSPRTVVAGDFNGDGKPDLATANQNSNNVSVLLGNGDGSFQPTRNFDVGYYAPYSAPASLVAGDFNGDGKPDLAVANFSSRSVAVLSGNGDGNFQAAVHFDLGIGATGGSPASITVGDFNRDEIPDLAVTTGSWNRVSVVLGNGDGSFQAAVNFPQGNTPYSVVAGDFNGDVKPDLAVVNYGSNSVSAILGKGDGTFQVAASFGTGGGSSSSPYSVVVGDFNGDGKPDLAVDNGVPTNSMSLLLGNGDGSFQAGVSFGTGSTNPIFVAVGDFNRDGKLDVAAASDWSLAPFNNISVLLGNGDGTVQAARTLDSYGSSPRFIAVSDVNGDGMLDLTIANSYSNTVSVLLGNGDGTFQTARYFSSGGISPGAVIVNDLNGDGIPELAVANSRSNAVSVILLNRDGTFQSSRSFTVGSNPWAVAVGDFNNDGKSDLAVGNSISKDVSVLLGNGDATFQSAVNVGVGSAPYSIAVEDFNGDAIQDLAVTSPSSRVVAVLLGNGDGSFQATTNFNVSMGSVFAVASDLNDDGKPDLAVASGDNKVSVLTNNSAPPPPTAGEGRVEQDNPAVIYTGAWYSSSYGMFSGGSAATSMDPGARVSVTFAATSISWIGYRDQWSGIARVFLDGVLVAEVDTYDPGSQAQAVLYTASGLSNTTHMLAIEVTGTKNLASLGTWVWVDAFQVQP